MSSTVSVGFLRLRGLRPSAVGGSSGRIARCELRSGATPLLRRDLDFVRACPASWNSCCAVGRSKIAIVAPPIDEHRCELRDTGDRERAERRRPSRRRCCLRLRSASSSRCSRRSRSGRCRRATCPSTSVSGLNRWSSGGVDAGRQSEASRRSADDLAVPAYEMGLVGDHTRQPEPVCGSCRTLVSTAAGKAGVCWVLLFVFLNATLPLMTASEFCVRLVDDRRERARDRVGEDVGAADHRDAEDDRECGQDACGAFVPSSPLRATPVIVRALPSPR